MIGLEGAVWHGEPPEWRLEGGTLEVVTGQDTDFWRVTHYGFVRDDGHFLHHTVAGDFVAEVRFAGEYQHLYDQAGLMLRLDERHWIKAGVEYTEGHMHLSAVVTREFSDWSVLALEGAPQEVRLRVGRQGGAVMLQYALEDGPFSMFRLAHLPEAETLQVGVMCCSPKRAGFRARFWGFEVRPGARLELHAGEPPSPLVSSRAL